MSAHTPGPWRWVKPIPGKLELVSGISRVLFRKSNNLDSGLVTDIDPSSPDAKLIEAAPDLLAALEEIYEWTSYKDTAWAKRAKAAIDKAKGVQP